MDITLLPNAGRFKSSVSKNSKIYPTVDHTSPPPRNNRSPHAVRGRSSNQIPRCNIRIGRAYRQNRWCSAKLDSTHKPTVWFHHSRSDNGNTPIRDEEPWQMTWQIFRRTRSTQPPWAYVWGGAVGSLSITKSIFKTCRFVSMKNIPLSDYLGFGNSCCKPSTCYVWLGHGFAILLQRQDADYMLCSNGESFLGGPSDLCMKRNPALLLRSRECNGDGSRNWWGAAAWLWLS